MSSLKKAQVLQTQNGFSNSFCTKKKKRAFCEIVTMLLCEFIWPVQWIFVFLSFFRSLVRRKLFNSLALRGIANILIEKRTQQFFYSFFQFFFLFCSLCKNLFHNGSFSIIHSPQRMYFKFLTSSFEVTFIWDANATLKSALSCFS